MKYLNILTIAGMVLLMMTSCGKENITTTLDNVPEVEPGTEIVETSSTPPSFAAIANNGSTALARFVFDSTTMLVNNYSLVTPSSLVGAPGVVFSSAWVPVDPETEIQEATYSLDGVETISQEGIDAWEEWEANGSDPNTMPDLFSPDSPYLTQYTGTITYEISNITPTTADVVVSGDIVDPNGNTTTLAGDFTADRYY